MIFLEPAFLIFAVLTVALTQYRERGLAQGPLILVIDLAFLLLFLGPLQSVILLLFALAGYAALGLAGRQRRGALAGAVTAMLALFIVLKKYTFLPDWLRLDAVPVAVGLSYVLFRLLHLVIDRGQGGVDPPRLPEYLHYTLSCYALTSGPFQRYEEHQQVLQAARRPDPLPQLGRIASGYVKVVVMAKILKGVHALLMPASLAAGAWPAAGLPGADLAAMLAAALVWVVFMYFNFSGYMDIVIGWARLCRMDLPENFDRPWLASGFLDFWGRWHMTMTGWFKTYVFNSLMIVMGRRFTSREAAPALSSAAFFITFLLVGAWHGTSAPFLICGLLLGAGATVNQITREYLRRRGRKSKPAPTPPALELLGAALAYTYISVAVAPFWLNVQQFLPLLRALAQPHGIIIFSLCCLALAPAVWLLRRAVHLLGESEPGASRWRQAPMAVALRIFVVLLFVLATPDSLPDFVYKGI